MYRLAWILGAIGLPLAHHWLAAKIEPFYSLIYCFLWWSYIFAADFAVFLLRGKSLLRDRPGEFLVLCIWSVPLWMLFEMVNLRIENWYYVMAPCTLPAGLMYMVLGFGSVLPGIFETAELVIGAIERWAPGGKITGRPFAVPGWNVAIQMLIGAAMLVLLLACPKSCGCMAWGFAFFLVDPICYWLGRTERNHVGRSLLGQLASGDNTRLVALLAAGLVCGGLWEAWNLGARTKWIYSVPFFDELKIGEMPVLGFLGFPPFALECYAMVNLLSFFRGGRSWELSAAENRQRRGMPAWGIAVCAVLLPVGIFFGGLATMSTAASFAVPLDWYLHSALGTQGVEALRKRDALQGHQLLKLKERPPEIDPAFWAHLRQIARMGELKGMGLANALALEKLKITRFDELARQNPADLASKLNRLGWMPVRAEEVKVWIRAAGKQAADAG